MRRRGCRASFTASGSRAARSSAYYHGFSNRTLWPLLHGLVEHLLARPPHWWPTYRVVNERFAERAFALADGRRAVLGPRLPPDAACRGCCARATRTRGSPSSSTSRSRRPRCSAGCRGASSSSTGCSARAHRLPDAAVPRQLRSARALPRRRRRGGGTTAAAPGRADRRQSARIRSRSTRPRFAERARGAGRRARAAAAAQPVRAAAASCSASTGSTTRRASWSGCGRSSSCSSSAGPARRVVLRPDRGPEPRRHPRVPRPAREQVEQLVGRINGRFTEPGRDVAGALPLPRRQPGPAARLLPRSPTSAS